MVYVNEKLVPFFFMKPESYFVISDSVECQKSETAQAYRFSPLPPTWRTTHQLIAGAKFQKKKNSGTQF